MAEKPPYIAQPSVIPKALEKIQNAATPEKFTQDFLETVLKMKGGNARQIIPFFKKVGFLASDASPTNLYIQYRNQSKSGAALAEALKQGYSSLFAVNEYAHRMSDKELKALVVEVTGKKPDDQVVGLITSCFKNLNKDASFDETLDDETSSNVSQNSTPSSTYQIPQSSAQSNLGMNLSYTINLNLPATTDIEVFNSIFKSLKENLLKNG